MTPARNIRKRVKTYLDWNRTLSGVDPARNWTWTMNSSKTSRIRLRVREARMTRGSVIETVFLTAEVPFVRIFGEHPIYTALCAEKDVSKLLKPEIKDKLKKKGIEVQMPLEMKARSSVFLRRLDKHVGDHTKEELQEELRTQQEWAKDAIVIKIKDYSHVLKIEFPTIEAANMALEKGVLLFHMHVTPEQISRDEFISILTCFKCYKMEDHPTKNCRETKDLCSECAEEGHRWAECTSQVKRCLNCGGSHRTLAMACPEKKKWINEKRDQREREEREKKNKTYSEVIKETIKETQTKPKPTQILLGTEQSYIITTCIIHAHFVNMANPGSYESELNKMLVANNLPPVKAPHDVPSEELFGAKMAPGVKIAAPSVSVEEGLDEIINLAAQRDPRKHSMMDVGSVYSRSAKGSTEEEGEQPRRSREPSEDGQHATRPKEQRDKKAMELDARSLGLKIYAGESNRFPEAVQYEDLVEGIKKNKYKMTYSDKRTETEIMGLLDKRKIKISSEDLKVVPEDVFRKVRQGKEQTPPSKHPKKPWLK